MKDQKGLLLKSKYHIKAYLMLFTTISKITHPFKYLKCQQFIYVQKYKNKKCLDGILKIYK